jgi:GTPase SAR1 family protein
MRDRQGFILVYDITNSASVDDLNDLYTQILRNKLTTPSTHSSNPSAVAAPVIPLVLVGNKLDLAMERKVSHQRGKDLSRQWKCPHYETSAKTRTNVDEIFYDLVRQIVAINEEAVRVQKGNGGGMSLVLRQKEGEEGEEGDGAGCSSCCVS